MGTAERREREKLQRQEEILDAAERVFIRKSLASATMDDIAEEAELSKGTLYLYFRSKELIYFGLDLRGSRILRDRFREAVSKHPEGLNQIREIGLAYFAYAKQFPIYFQSMAYGERLDPQALKELSDEPIVLACREVEGDVLGIMVESLERGMADGSIRQGIKPIEVAVSLWAMSNGVIQMYTNRGEYIGFEDVGLSSPQFLLDTFHDFIYHSLAARPGQFSPPCNKE